MPPQAAAGYAQDQSTEVNRNLARMRHPGAWVREIRELEGLLVGVWFVYPHFFFNSSTHLYYSFPLVPMQPPTDSRNGAFRGEWGSTHNNHNHNNHCMGSPSLIYQKKSVTVAGALRGERLHNTMAGITQGPTDKPPNRGDNATGSDHSDCSLRV